MDVRDRGRTFAVQGSNNFRIIKIRFENGNMECFFCGQADCPRFLRRPVLFVDEIVGRRCFSPGDERFVALKSRGGESG